MAVGRVSVRDLPNGFFQPDQRAISLKDVLLVAALPILVIVAWCCPDSLCLRLVRSATRWLGWLRPKRYQEYDKIFSDYLPQRPRAAGVAALSREAAALQHLERLQLLRYFRPGSWRPSISIEGMEHLEQALAKGMGAILWVTFATFSDMISKVALHGHGYRVWHLSRHIHGHFSSTRFGIRFLNPIRIAVERRYLAERVVIDPAEPKAALACLGWLLAGNRVVSITVGPMARRVTLVPFGPGYLPLAGGAPSLAISCGATLLPLFTERCPDGSFLVTIEPPLKAPDELSREQKITELTLREAALLRRYFERLPTQFLYADLHHVRGRCQDLSEAREEEASNPVA